MDWQGWVTIGVVLAVLAALVLTRVSADLALLGGIAVLLTCRVLDERDALGGFANDGLLTVALLFVVAAGVRDTGAMAFLTEPALGRPRSATGAQVRMMLPVTGLSAFLNNTPLVAIMLPIVADWAKRNRVSPSKVMIPLSYASILGGLCTLIGTSTNVVVSGLLVRQTGEPLHMFDPTWVGVPCAAVGLAYIVLGSRWLLPDRRPALGDPGDPRQYTVEMLVDPGSPLAGRTVEQAGLRHLPGLYLVEIDRDGEVLPAVGPAERLRAGDRLVFVGVVESVVDLQKTRGLKPATDQVFELGGSRAGRCLIEAVVSDTCPLAGRTIRDGRFRTVYGAAVIALARNGERVGGKLGDVTLRPGDTLLLEADPAFADRHRNSRDFFLVSRVEDSSPAQHDRAWRALAVLAGMVVVAGAGWLSTLNAALLAAGLMLVTGCCSVASARRSIDWQVLVAIGAAFGIGRALETTGVAAAIARTVLGPVGGKPWLALAAVYGLTMLFTEVLSNTAAAVLTFPVAVAAAGALGVSHMPFVMAVLVAASCGFATPIGYQTNLMVYGPGGYRFDDYLRFGGLLNLVIWAVTVAVTPLAWPFRP
jgi:di/tricarboxylate transporter